MICFHCGKEIADTSQVCPNCGKATTIFTSQLPVAPISEISTSQSELPTSNNNKTASFDPDDLSAKVLGSPKTKKVMIFLGLFLAAVLVGSVGMSVYTQWKQSPDRVSETGTYNLSLYETVEFSSVHTSVTFEDFYVGTPDYDTLSVPVDILLRVTFPDTNMNSRRNWLSDFCVDGTSISQDTRYYTQGLDYIQYKIPYTAVYDRNDCQITCKINDNLNINIDFQYSFWDFDGIDKEYAIAYKQEQIDSEYGITFVDWRTDANSLDYIEGNLYKMTGKIQTCGKYMGNLTDKYYITLTAARAFPGVDTHCYFSEAEWNKAPTISSGDIVTFYGYYEFWGLGWNFENCTFESPAGVFTIEDKPDSQPATNASKAPAELTSETKNVQYSDFVGNFFASNAIDGISIEMSGSTLEILCAGYREEYFTATVDTTKSLSGDTLRFRAHASYSSDIYDVFLTYTPAKNSPNGVDTIYMRAQGLFDMEYTRYAYDEYSESNGTSAFVPEPSYDGMPTFSSSQLSYGVPEFFAVYDSERVRIYELTFDTGIYDTNMRTLIDDNHYVVLMDFMIDGFDGFGSDVVVEGDVTGYIDYGNFKALCLDNTEVSIHLTDYWVDGNFGTSPD